MKHLRATEVGRFKDGGTKRVLAEDGHHYFVDYSKESKKRGISGGVFSGIPSLKSSKKLSIQIEVISKEDFDKLMKKKANEHNT